MFKEWDGQRNVDQDENWRAFVKKRIDYFLSTLEPDQRQQLDYSMDSLVVFGQWFLNKYDDINDVLDEEEKEPEYFQGAILYLGETDRKHLGGYWSIVSVEDTYMAYPPGTEPVAVIEGFYEEDMICPIDDFLNMAEERFDTYFRQGLGAVIMVH